jgi:hypothetical protein
MSIAPPPSRPRSTTQPLEWDWVKDWSNLEIAVREAEFTYAWDWRRELDELHKALDDLARRYGI